MDATLLQYGAIGAMLIYFIWKDKSTFEMYKNTMQRMADLLGTIQKEQGNIEKFDRRQEYYSTSYGKIYTKNSFGSSWREKCQ